MDVKSKCRGLTVSFAASLLLAWSCAASWATDIRFTAGEYSKCTRPFFEQVAKDYKSSHPDVHISVEVVSWDAYLQKLTTDINSNIASQVSRSFQRSGCPTSRPRTPSFRSTI